MVVNIKLIKCNRKLNLCKVIKEYTGIGLREAKDFCDLLHSKPGVYQKINLSEDGYRGYLIEDLLKDLNECGEFELSRSLNHERESKILSLGVGETEDYINYIVEEFKYINIDKRSDLLDFILGKLDKEELKSVLMVMNSYK